MPRSGRYRTPSSASETDSSYDDAREVEGLLSILSPNPTPSHSYAHTPEGQFQSLNIQSMLTPMDTEMPGGMRESHGKGKSPEPPSGSVGRYFDQTSQGWRETSPVPGGSGDPDPGTGTSPVRPPRIDPLKKKHIKKPEDFIDAKNWEKFKQQEFLYYKEYFNEFGFDDATRIRFNLSFFVGGLPEKFVANFIDQIIGMSLPRWGTFQDFRQKCEEAFQDTNKKTNAENQLTLLRQGSKTAKEFFQEFNLLVFTAGYTDTHHDNVLIRLLHKAIHDKVIDLVYSQPALPSSPHTDQTSLANRTHPLPFLR